LGGLARCIRSRGIGAECLCGSAEQRAIPIHVKRAHECREMQDKLVGKQALTAERVDEITRSLDQAGCTAHLQAR
jgi:hypothetical protein